MFIVKRNMYIWSGLQASWTRAAAWQEATPRQTDPSARGWWNIKIHFDSRSSSHTFKVTLCFKSLQELQRKVCNHYSPILTWQSYVMTCAHITVGMDSVSGNALQREPQKPDSRSSMEHCYVLKSLYTCNHMMMWMLPHTHTRKEWCVCSPQTVRFICTMWGHLTEAMLLIMA